MKGCQRRETALFTFMMEPDPLGTFTTRICCTVQAAGFDQLSSISHMSILHGPGRPPLAPWDTLTPRSWNLQPEPMQLIWTQCQMFRDAVGDPLVQEESLRMHSSHRRLLSCSIRDPLKSMRVRLLNADRANTCPNTRFMQGE